MRNKGLNILRHLPGLVAIVALLTLGFDWLFYDQVIGWTPAIFMGVLGATLLLRQRFLFKQRRLLLIGFYLFCLLAYIIEPGVLSYALNAAVLFVILLTDRHLPTKRFTIWIERVVGFAIVIAFQWIMDLCLLIKARVRGRSVKRLMKHPVAWSIACLLGMFFIVMFTIANPVMAAWLSDMGDYLRDWQQQIGEFVTLIRVMFWVLCAWVCWGLIRGRLKKQLWREDRADEVKITSQRTTISSLVAKIPVALVVRCLIVFNVVFLIQTSMDIFYLFGGTSLPEGMSYASYAHRGAYPLIATALLAGIFVLIGFHPKGPAQRDRLSRYLVYAWLAQNVFLVFTSLWRLQIYVSVYSLSRWRVAAAIWMVLIAIGIVFILIRIFKEKDNLWLIKRNMAALVIVLMLCCIAPIDRMIAQYNVDHCKALHKEGVVLDLNYLAELGVDALPALQTYMEQTKKGERQEKAAQLQLALSGELHHQLKGWRGWTLNRSFLLPYAKDEAKQLSREEVAQMMKGFQSSERYFARDIYNVPETRSVSELR